MKEESKSRKNKIFNYFLLNFKTNFTLQNFQKF